ncbi:MAG: phosphodiesterase YaeI [Acidobacteriota bacterium]
MTGRIRPAYGRMGRVPALAARLGRRRLIRAGAVAVASAAATAIYVRYLETRWLDCSRLRIPIDGLPAVFRGFRIVQLTDIHHSSVVPLPYIESCIDAANDMKPDLVVLTGDYITTSGKKYTRPVIEALNGLRARLGVCAVLGNHDYGVYRFRVSKRDPHAAESFAEHFERSGIRLLVNESIRVRLDGASLAVVGLDDLWSGGFAPEAAFDGIEPQVPRLVLSHNPDSADLLARFRSDLIVSGHTHGGQVVLPLIGAPLLPVQNRERRAGLYSVGDGLLYVNRGIGHLAPVRFNCRPEISLFELTPV